MKRDALFGPIVLFGLGGIFVEVFQDVALRLAPLDMAGARAMMDETRGIALLKGARGAVPCDLDAIAQLIVRLGDFSLAHADSVLEVDINPLVVDAQAHGVMHVVDALIVLGSGAAGSGAAGSR